ncbi:low molecular weight phosphotyrosine protein phosphatase [Rhodobacteraceae bacterium RKSG542]|uniref:low molecular weight protein-tyrosine-phosphatase n=1 Tax=Pseudovibrio flavus TaxID=2529854 RepID=UPI003526D4BC|nr:low molecular weight phosphotyrosine protein phosphatase [Pseudovibrio flavus]
MPLVQRRVLFVCLGNICRSPLAEGLFRHHVLQAGLEGQIYVDSAGTGAWHVGNPPDPRSVSIGNVHGVDISRQRARQVEGADFNSFHHIIAMDRSNLQALEEFAPSSYSATTRLLLQASGQDVPDPYYGGSDGFQLVYEMLRDGTFELLEEIRAEMDC